VDLRSAAEVRAKKGESTAELSRTLECSVYSEPAAQSGVWEAVRVSRVGSVSLVAVSPQCTTTTVGTAPGAVMRWSEGFDRLYPNRPAGMNLSQPWAAMLLAVDPDEAAPAVIGTRRLTIL
jgi:hypothetical protein